jgi:voltage-gated potassium channel
MAIPNEPRKRIDMPDNLDENEGMLENERNEALEQVKNLLEPVVLVLAIVWLALLIVELVWGSTPFTQTLVWVIWAVFLIDFVIRLIIAPRKLIYLRNNWLTTLSLFVPALRLFRLASLARILYATRTVRSLQLLRVVSSLNRGMRSLRGHMQRRQVGYIIALTFLVSLVAAAAMFFFERSAPEGGFESYWDALYWTGMLMTTLGSEYWPQSGEGRVVALLLSLYALGILGYITATLATFFIGREADSAESELATIKSIESLQAEVAALRTEIQRLTNQQ